jgi:aminoglycoside 6'-N-acetyltransferase
LRAWPTAELKELSPAPHRIDLRLRPATTADAPLLRRWESAPHLAGLLGDDDWQWETALATERPAHRPFIAEVENQPIGFLEILDPALDPGRYWGDLPPGHRALDLWIGEPGFLGCGYGREMMRQAVALCFSDPTVHTILVDPLASNTVSHRFYESCGFRFIEERWFGADRCYVLALSAFGTSRGGGDAAMPPP